MQRAFAGLSPRLLQQTAKLVGELLHTQAGIRCHTAAVLAEHKPEIHGGGHRVESPVGEQAANLIPPNLQQRQRDAVHFPPVSGRHIVPEGGWAQEIDPPLILIIAE